ncbi:MAG: nucleoside-diphosphate sugar epimerase [Alphaproteobacteria bacterium]|nr:nucleoside-diphosphate sugar epimerase [Alphaproteobacteria bacterium]
MNPPVVWVLADDRAGNRAQCLGVADRLGLSYKTKEIRYNAFVKLPNSLRGKSLIGLDGESTASIKAPWPDVVIAAGRRTAPVARYIKAQNPDVKLVQLMWPDAAPDEFDCIVLPSHDRDHSGGKDGEAANILRVLGAPHRVTPELLETARKKWLPPLYNHPAPRIALLAGGGNKHDAFSEADWTKLGELAASFATKLKGSLLISTSRRTGKEGEATLKAAIGNTPHRFYSPLMKDEENPYMGYLALADAIIITADSIAMCSEACASGKPVYFFEPASLSAKHARFVNTLIATGYAFPFTADFTDAIRAPLKKTTLDSAGTVAAHLFGKGWLGNPPAALEQAKRSV